AVRPARAARGPPPGGARRHVPPVLDRDRTGEPTMALTEKAPSRWWSRLHFLVLFTLLTGLLVAGVGCVLALLDGLLTPEVLTQAWDNVRAGAAAAVPWQLALLAGGLAALLLALLFEAVVFLRVVAGRRSVFGLNAGLQIALAVLLLVGVNLF